MTILLLVATSLLAAGPPAGPASPTYDDAPLRAAIPPGVQTIGLMVVGEFDARAAAARGAVAGALRAAGDRVRLVGGAPGTFAEPPEPGMIERLCSLFHLDLVAVIWPGPTSLRVELVDRAGKPLVQTTLSARPEVTAPARPEVTAPARPEVTAPPPRPVAVAAAPAPVAEAPTDPRLRALGEELYASEHLTMRWDGSTYQGRNRRPVEGADFYATVGRPDLAQAYREREQNRHLVAGLGGVTLGLGVIWGIADVIIATTATAVSAVPCLLSGGSSRSAGDWCDPPQASVLPWGVAALGLGLVVVPLAISSDPISQPERRQLLDRHNEDLRARTGLGAARLPAVTVRLAPLVGPGGGGMMLSGSFD